MIETLFGDRIISEQKSPPDDPVRHLHNRDFTGGKQFRACQTSLHCRRLQTRSLSAATAIPGRMALCRVHYAALIQNHPARFRKRIPKNAIYPCVPAQMRRHQLPRSKILPSLLFGGGPGSLNREFQGFVIDLQPVSHKQPDVEK